MIIFVTTADTEILALSQAMHDLPAGFPALKAVNPTRLQDGMAPEALDRGGVNGAGAPPGRTACLARGF